MIEDSAHGNPSPAAGTDAHSKPTTINGSRHYWISTRLVAIFLLALLVLVNVMSDHRGVSAMFSMFFAFATWFALLRRTAYGYIERDGIRYKKYFRWRTVRWEDIEDIAQPFRQFRPWSIIVTLKNENPFNRRIYFPLNPMLFATLSTIEASGKELTRAWLAGT